ncbi:MAG: hypothetical protein H6Q21_2411 [Bacteroidetes bacterium]|jgi:hypothetical protein|nr:hypothetical protein [Bacteroidota bacterium]
MPFEFDENKSILNRKKHGIDFIEAQNLWNDPERVIIPAREMDEIRNMIIGRIERTVWSAIYTIRKENIRIISVRKARENEKEIYESL